MPAWVQVILGAAAVATALGVLWTKVLRPFVRVVSTIELMYPVAVQLTATLGATPHAFDVLEDIVAQFRTDSGSSLRDAVNRLEDAAETNAAAAAELKVGVESSRQLAVDDRTQLQRLVLLLDRLTVKVEAVDASGARIEADQAHVAEDLAAAQQRADQTAGDAGAAADAASQSADGVTDE